MTFNAQEIALIITSSATAITAISAVVVPLWGKAFDARSRRNEEIQNSFRQAIDCAFVQAERRSEWLKDTIIDVARLSLSQAPEQKDLRSKSQTDSFDLAILRLEVLGKSHGIDTSVLCALLGAWTGTHSQYWKTVSTFKFDDQSKALEEATEKSGHLRSKILDEVDQIWSVVRKKYPV